MKVEYKTVIEIEGLGVFRNTDSWKSYDSYEEVNGFESFISFEGDRNNYINTIFSSCEGNINIVSATDKVVEFINKLRKNEK